jgi:hypothetical protein
MTRTKWTDKQIETLIAMYSDSTMQQLTAAIGRSECSIYNKAAALGLCKSAQHIERMQKITTKNLVEGGAKTRFQKGNATWNKGVKGFMGANKTSFKKGNVPPQTREVGAESFDKDKKKMIKQADGQWKYEHVLLWESVHGELPKDKVIKFLDGNINNLKIENLQAIGRGELMLINTIYRYPKELQSAIKTLNKLKRKLKDATKQT